MNPVIKYGVDIVLAILFLIELAEGYKRGFIRSLIGLIVALLSISCAQILSGPAAQIAYDTVVENYLTQRIEQALPEGIDGESAKQTVEAVVAELPDFLLDELDKNLDISLNDIAEQIRSEDLSRKATVQTIMDKVAEPCAVPMLKMILFILIFVLTRAVLNLVAKPLKRSPKLPVLNQANHLLGLIMGIARGFAMIYLTTFVLRLIHAFTGDGLIAEALNNSFIFNTFSSFDLLGVLKLRKD